MKTLEKDVFSSGHECGTKVPMRKRTSDIRILRSDAMPLSHRDSTMSEVYYEVHIISLSHVRDKKKKTSFFISLPSLELTYHLSYFYIKKTLFLEDTVALQIRIVWPTML